MMDNKKPATNSIEDRLIDGEEVLLESVIDGICFPDVCESVNYSGVRQGRWDSPWCILFRSRRVFSKANCLAFEKPGLRMSYGASVRNNEGGGLSLAVL
jgi:hypothetical protein